MSNPDIPTEIAQSILEHAAAMTRLDAGAIGEAAYEAAFASHLDAIRLVAVDHVDPQPDRQLLRQLRTLASDTPGVFIQLDPDGAVQLIVDSASRQHRFKLWTRKQLLKNEEEDDFAGL